MKNTTHLVPLVDLCQQQKVAGNTNEEIIAFLRAQGCSKMESIFVVAHAFTIGLNDAKEIVHLSKAWTDVYERDNQFHQIMEETCRKEEG